MVDRYQQHEIPLVTVKLTQHDQHAVACACGKVHTAKRPDGARPGPVGYGPNLQALCVYLMVVHFVPAHRCRALLASLTGARPSVGFVHSMLARAAVVLDGVDKRIRALLTLAHVVCADETPLRIGPAAPAAGGKKAQRYLLVACTELLTHYLVGGRDLDTFKAMVIKDLAAGSVIVHDRYQNYDAEPFAHLLHQLCAARLPVHRRQTRTQPDDRPARRGPRPPLDARLTRHHLTPHTPHQPPVPSPTATTCCPQVHPLNAYSLASSER